MGEASSLVSLDREIGRLLTLPAAQTVDRIMHAYRRSAKKKSLSPRSLWVARSSLHFGGAISVTGKVLVGGPLRQTELVLEVGRCVTAFS